jgi:hypothetical protein
MDRSQYSAVGIATGCGLDDRGGQSSSPGRVKNFLFSTLSRLAMGSTQPPIRWIPVDLTPGVKRPGREADLSPSASGEVKKMWIYTSNPHTPSWHNAQLVKRSENFIFYILKWTYWLGVTENLKLRIIPVCQMRVATGPEWPKTGFSSMLLLVSCFAYFFTLKVEAECQAVSDYRCYNSQNCTFLTMYKICILSSFPILQQKIGELF